MSTGTGKPVIAPSDEAYVAWRAAVAGVLAKARKVDPATLGGEPERILTSTTYDGLELAPLYTGRDELPELPLPGQPPYVRGRTAVPGWRVCVRHGHTAGAPADVNETLLDDLGNGAEALWLTVGGPRPVDDLGPVLAGVRLDLVPVVLDAGEDVTSAAQLLLGLAERAVDPAAVDLCLGADPYGSWLRAGASGTGPVLDEAVGLARSVPGREGSVRALLVDGTVLHDAGASDAEELGAAVAAGVAYLRALTAAGFSAADALGHIDFRLAATDDQFATIAKLRAARQVWARVADVVGAPQAGGMRQHAVTSAAMATQRDPWVNLLRGTVAAFAAGVGGADTVTVLPFDAAIPGGAPGAAPGFARRLARNTGLLLLEESNVGRVRDPAGGSWYVESLTADLAAAAWTWFQQLEAAGGFQAAVVSGLVAERIAATGARRDQDVAHRRAPITGVSEFPDLAETPLPPQPAPRSATAFAPRRYAQPYEDLRDRSDAHLAATGSRPRVFLATIGTAAQHTARVTFVTNLLAAGGIETVHPVELADPAALEAAFRDSGTGIACLCGTDRGYREHGAEVVRVLRDAGAGEVLGAGGEQVFAGLPDDARPDGCLTLGTDAVAALGGLLDRLGVS